MLTETFIRNDLSIEVDNFKQTNRYFVKSLWRVGSETKERVVEDFTMTWEEVEQEGGADKVRADFEECYKKEAPKAEDEKFIRNELNIDNDPFKSLITYKVSALYDVKRVCETGTEYWKLKARVIEEFSLTWDEVDKRGHHNVIMNLREKYNIVGNKK